MPGQADTSVPEFCEYRSEAADGHVFTGVLRRGRLEVKSNLTLTFALRAEHFSNPVCQTNCFARLTGPFSEVSHDPDQPYNEAIDTGLHQALQGMQAIAWSPRFGFAWQPFGAQKNIVVRGGFGIFYDQFPAQVVDNFSQNAHRLWFVPAGLLRGALRPPSPPANLAPTETTGNAYSMLAAPNAQFVNGFGSGATLAELTAANPLFTPPSYFTANAETKVPTVSKVEPGDSEGLWCRYSGFSRVLREPWHP